MSARVLKVLLRASDPLCTWSVLSLVLGCASTAQTGARSPSPPPPPASLGSSAAAPRTLPVPTPDSARGETRPRASEPGPRAPEFVLDPKLPLRPLPELKVENNGLHIGGGPNDAQAKAPFLNAIRERFPAFMDCYRKSEAPAQGGRFGIDLHIGRSGGHPELEQPRTALRGAEFRSCLHRAFESIEFQKPERGPTTISYSLRFVLVEAP